MTLSHQQRFDITQTNGINYAPLSWGCPSMLFVVDRSIFKKSLQEKINVFTHKKRLGKSKNHKFETFFRGAF